MAEMNEREDSEVEEAARELRVLQEEEGQLMLTRDFAQLRRILKGELKEAESILARVNVSSPLYEACKAEVEKVKARLASIPSPAKVQTPTFTVRPTKELLPKLQKLAAETGKSEGMILQESAAAIIEMIEKGYDFVPSLVQQARVLRELSNRGTEGQLGGATLSQWDREKILPSETVRNLSPELVFLPVFPAFYIVDPYRVNLTGAGTEKIGIPKAKRKGANLGFKIGPNAERPIRPIKIMGDFFFVPGDILLVSKWESYVKYWKEKDPSGKQAPREGESQLDFLGRVSVTVVGWYGNDPFIGVTLPLYEGEQNDNPSRPTVGTRTGLSAESTVELPLRECRDIMIVVQEVYVPRPAKSN